MDPMENANHRYCDKYLTEIFQEEYDGLSESQFSARYLVLSIVMLSATLKNYWEHRKLVVANSLQ